jgi:predicted small lipoprotein YifL
MKTLVALALAALLASCGVKGDPVPPSEAAEQKSR